MKQLLAGASLGIIAASAMALGATYSNDSDVDRQMAQQRLEAGDMDEYTAAVVVQPSPSPGPRLTAYLPEGASGE